MSGASPESAKRVDPRTTGRIGKGMLAPPHHGYKD
jgi:hypothetical protein